MVDIISMDPFIMHLIHSLKTSVHFHGKTGLNFHRKHFSVCVLQAKMESERLIVSVGKKAPQETGMKVRSLSGSLALAHQRDFQQLLQGLAGRTQLHLADFSLKEFAGFHIALLNKVALSGGLREPRSSSCVSLLSL